MTAEQFLSVADALRTYALHSRRDLNAANLFVHSVLMRAIQDNGELNPAALSPRELIERQRAA
jgi:hypothetical protein